MRSAALRTALSCALLLIPAVGTGSARVTGGRVHLQADAAMRAPLTVSFTADVDPGAAVLWDFGDGLGAQGPSVSHVYYRPGSYPVTVQLPGGQARTTVVVQGGAPEAAGLVVLLSPGGAELSAAGSTIYAPYTPRFLLDGQPVGGPGLRPAAGEHAATVLINGASGPVQRTVRFRTAPVSSDPGFGAQVLALTNDARARGWDCTLKTYDLHPALAPLRPNAQLARAAMAQSAGMAMNGYFDHRSAVDGSTPALRAEASGYAFSSVGENIAAGQRTPAEVVDGWLRSPGHCRNIMGTFSELGVAYVSAPQSGYGTYWTQVFGEPGR